jgi:antitoxin (DNA-binding transcriptional repressor) of toxin-antitoxin stability system
MINIDTMKKVIGLRMLRENLLKYETAIKHGESFIVMKKNKPIFQLTPIEEQWETVIDFTVIKKGGVEIDELLKRL